LSWARLGARVTGADFSPAAIETARSLAADTGIEATFVLSELYDLPNHLDRHFDIVYTSNGVLGWLPDIDAWAGIVDHFLAPGGTFYITEFHPVMWSFDDSSDVTDMKLKYPYFARSEPTEFPVENDYADPEAEVKTKSHFAWSYSLGSVVTSLAQRGLRIEFLHEFDHCASKVFPFMDERDDRFFLPEWIEGEIPLSFSLKATKP
jgi:SAM-dependent methyltransferase